MIRSGKPEDLKSIYGLRKVQVSLNSDSQELYFQHQFNYRNVIVNEVNGQLKASLQLEYQPMVLKNRRVMCSIITGEFSDGRASGYLNELLEDAVRQLQAMTLVSAVFGANSARYQKIGFEPVYNRRVYTVKRSMLKDISDSGIGRKFMLSELRDLYREFTSHFDGYLLRSDEYWTKLMDYYLFLNYFVVVYRDENKKAQGYMVYHTEKETLVVDEIVYRSGLALLRMLAHAARVKPQVNVRVSQYEDLSLAIPDARFKLESNCSIRINDLELHNRLYKESCDSAVTAMLSSDKPLWISRGY
ncbi:MAG: hypothetical protein IJM15_02010 [Erysipelotrichaceae bacterium]|nr:hypothetical protein [Erysipelotrichaceae bacterium]